MQQHLPEEQRLRFRQAAALLPAHLRRAAEQLPTHWQERCEELRLRAGRPMTAVLPKGEEPVPESWDAPIRSADLHQVLEIATRASAHTALERVRNGFVTVKGGHRIGLCGSGVVRDGEVCNLRELSSLAIRVAHSVPGTAGPILDGLLDGGSLRSTLILSPPGWGKTTLLRDLVRMISDGIGIRAMRVGVADERGELAAMCDGLPQMDVGTHTDVMDGCPKAAGLLMLLRGMNPQVLAADEITAPEDCAALETAANCGVVLLATAHGASVADLSARALYRSLLEKGVFQRAVTIQYEQGYRKYLVERLGTGA